MRVNWGRIGLTMTLAALVVGPSMAATTVMTPADDNPVVSTAAAHPGHIKLSGSIRGTYTVQRGVPDVGAGYSLNGSGRVRPLGEAQATGEFHTLGFIASGQVNGQLVLSNGKGSIVLKLVGPKQKGFSPPPGSFHYDITSGTGAYGNANGSGTVHLSLKKASAGGAGQFTLRFGGILGML